MKATTSSKRQVILPPEIRKKDGIQPNQQLEIQRIDRSKCRLLRRDPLPNKGLVNWLLACPHKGFFTTIPSESTNTL